MEKPKSFRFKLPEGSPEWPSEQAAKYAVTRTIKATIRRKVLVYERSQPPMAGTAGTDTPLAPPRHMSSKRRIHARTLPQPTQNPQTALQTSQTSKTPTNFLDLPGEIRNTIYRLVTVSDEPVQAQLRQVFKLTPGHKKRAVVTRKLPLEPPLSSASRQLRKEVLSIHYGENTFIFENSKRSCMVEATMMQRWRLRLSALAQLTSIDIRLQGLRPSGRKIVFPVTCTKSTKSGIRIALEEPDCGPFCYHSCCPCKLERLLKRINKRADNDKSLPLLSLVILLVIRWQRTLIPEGVADTFCADCDRFILWSADDEVDDTRSVVPRILAGRKRRY